MSAAATPAFPADYRDRFEVDDGGAEEPASAWAQSALRGSAGAFGRVVWSGLLGFDLAAADSPGTLYGWDVTADAPTELVLTVDGSRMAGRMVFTRADGRVAWTTTVRHHTAVGSVAWALAAPVHRRLAPRCLEQARRRLVGQGNAR